MKLTIAVLSIASMIALCMAPSCFARDGLTASITTHQVDGLENRVSDLESRVDGRASAGGIAFLFGAFCALWAQNTGRSAWLWFFLGLFFSVITVIFLLIKNSEDLEQQKTLDQPQTFPPTKPA